MAGDSKATILESELRVAVVDVVATNGQGGVSVAGCVVVVVVVVGVGDL